ncbi:MAG TPA: hypothetical protein VLV16_05145 [Gemmatimonadales bacterium]|nr:hypothetical protein [Gemmatimonadales bacterium]
MAVGLIAVLAAPLCSQTTGMPPFNAPYRAFQRSEFGGIVSFPGGDGFSVEGVYRYASGNFDVGFRAGMLDPGAGNTRLLLSAEGRSRIITHNSDFPLDGALVAGVGTALASGSGALYTPVGLSLGRRIAIKNSSVTVVPYVQPTAFYTVDGESQLLFTLGFGADARLSPSLDARISAGVGDVHGVSLGLVWVH